jgi:hypothetical protein
MAVFRVPYPDDPERRRALFDQVAAVVVRHGTYEGTPEQGKFEGSTPIGGFAGSYRFLASSGELEVELTKKPWFVSTHMVEHEVRKYLARA